jgi:hypothetical protein
MQIILTIPDQVYSEDPAYTKYFEILQGMVNRMAVSHYKYGPIKPNATTCEVDELASARKRERMYLETGNTENLWDEANFVIIEAMFPQHEKAHFRSQTSAESPGLEFRE